MLKVKAVPQIYCTECDFIFVFSNGEVHVNVLDVIELEHTCFANHQTGEHR